MPNLSPAVIIRKWLDSVDVRIDGDRPWDIQVRDTRTFRRALVQGTLGLGEAYMDGWWECERLDQFFDRVLSGNIQPAFDRNLFMLAEFIKAHVVNLQRRSRAFKIGKHHYDTGNDFYRRMLDARMTYTCGYWQNAVNLDQAQEAKLDLVCRKLGLCAGDKVLDIGCGWGSFARFAAERYGVEVLGITVSKEQMELGRELCRGLPVQIALQDYRDVCGSFDHVVSLGMFEHVGYRNYTTYMRAVARNLKEGESLFLLHTIGHSSSVRSGDPWIEKYIFPNSMLPSIKQIGKAIEGVFVMEDWHNFGSDYDKTLMAWFDNFDRHWSGIKESYGERFYRMWKYFLLSSAGAFRARHIQLWQVIFSKAGVRGGYSRLS